MTNSPICTRLLRIAALTALLTAATIANAGAAVCVSVDTAHDTLSASERTAAVLLIAKQFEEQREQVVEPPCPNQYTVSHVQLGHNISVTLVGPGGRRDATAIGLEDLPAVYNQMVRSLLTGRPMDLTGVVDRTNVSRTQAVNLRVDSDSVFYARLGYAALFGPRTQGVPSMTLLGYRHELDTLGIDVSFLNLQFNQDRNYASPSGNRSASSGSWVKLEALYFKNPHANQTPYVGAGLSWTGVSISEGATSWSGSGLQAEFSAGYEMARASTLRLFLQADAGVPLYSLQSTTYNYGVYYYGPVIASTRHRYVPSIAVSLGLGWQRGRH
jgi:hypothetical protein